MVDTTGYYQSIREDPDAVNQSDDDEAIKELEYLLSLTINAANAGEEEPGISNITTGEFSIIPGSEYILKVSKKGYAGDQEEELQIPLTSGVKYNFNTDPEAISDYHNKLNELLENRKDILVKEGQSINVSLLSKELNMKEDEEYTFNLFPDSSHIVFPATLDSLLTTIFLKNETIQLSGKEQLMINFPYASRKAVNIQTEIKYLQDNFIAAEYNLDIDTIPFFSEIVVDTTGYYLRYQHPVFTQSDQSSSRYTIGNENSKTNPGIIFRVQIAASRRSIPQRELLKKYKGGREIGLFKEEGWYKYYIAETPTYFEAKQIMIDCGVEDAFIAAYDQNNKLALKDAMLRQYQQRMKERGRVIHDSILSIVIINFEFDKFSLHAAEEKDLDELVIEKLNEDKNYYVEIDGHTDVLGSEIYNYGLSDERALFVKELLIKKGIEENRIKTFSFGETQLLKACGELDDCDDSVHRVNRRVEIVIFSPAN